MIDLLGIELRGVQFAFSTIIVLVLVMLLPISSLQRAVVRSRSSLPMAMVGRHMASAPVASPDKGGSSIDHVIPVFHHNLSPCLQDDHLQL